jgi:hypothetical protein
MAGPRLFPWREPFAGSALAPARIIKVLGSSSRCRVSCEVQSSGTDQIEPIASPLVS